MKIDLDNVYETFIRIPLPLSWDEYIKLLHSHVFPLLHQLRSKKLIGWFCFLVHDRPPAEKDIPFVHLRIEFKKDLGTEQIKSILPEYCEYVGKLNKNALLNQIEGIDKEILSDSNLEEAWWIIGECSIWIMNMLQAHSHERNITPQQVIQFLHFFENALLLRYFSYRL